jgi:hypothetical protein
MINSPFEQSGAPKMLTSLVVHVVKCLNETKMLPTECLALLVLGLTTRQLIILSPFLSRASPGFFLSARYEDTDYHI